MGCDVSSRFSCGLTTKFRFFFLERERGFYRDTGYCIVYVRTVFIVTSVPPSPFSQRVFSSRASGSGKSDDRPKDRASCAMPNVSVTEFYLDMQV